jgi:tetratricopeptide (TPR) repeat protein
MWYAEDIGWLGRFDEAIAEADRAHQLDPLSPIAADDVGLIRIYTHKYDDGIAACQKYAKENPSFAPVHRCLVLGYWAKGMYAQMLDEYKIFGELSGDKNEAAVAAAMAEGYRSGSWKAALEKALQVRLEQRKSGYTHAGDIAVLYAGLGDKDNAFQWLNVAYRDREVIMIRLKTDPWLEPLRSDPRFAELIKKVGLP